MTVTLGADVSPADLLQGRSPSLDLDSLYGAGPTNPGSERFYAADGRKLQMGKTEAVGTGRLGAKQGFDLPRSASEQHATIPDRRNDENLPVAQTHLAFELNGGRLTGVGARIVAETFHRAMEGSSASVAREPDFTPRFGPNATTFDMRDLLFFAFEGKKALLNPLGD